MKKTLVYLCLYFMASTVLADDIVLNNKTNYPEKDNPSKIAVQWVNSSEATQKATRLMMKDLDQNSLMMLSKKGQIKLTLPKHAQYFRILVWSNGKQEPDLLTNWVNIVPNKTYTLNQDHLTSALLMSGSGC